MPGSCLPEIPPCVRTHGPARSSTPFNTEAAQRASAANILPRTELP